MKLRTGDAAEIAKGIEVSKSKQSHLAWYRRLLAAAVVRESVPFVDVIDEPPTR